MALGKDYAAQSCSIARALELVGERWTLLVIRDAFYGVRRYSDFRTRLGAPRAVLSARLRTLTEAGILDRIRYQQSPPRDEYVLTEQGRRLWPSVYALSVWGEGYYAGEGAGPHRLFRHADCGAPLDQGGNCRTCGGLVPPEDVEMLPGPGATAGDPVSRALLRPRRLLQPLVVTDGADGTGGTGAANGTGAASGGTGAAPEPA